MKRAAGFYGFILYTARKLRASESENFRAEMLNAQISTGIPPSVIKSSLRLIQMTSFEKYSSSVSQPLAFVVLKIFQRFDEPLTYLSYPIHSRPPLGLF
jgi:hypothetical protein